ncbi:MAG: aspartate aminotransferase family protein [Kiritimatiellae bacterium]|jgi:acetylornithine/N-succinyldiaminopimelate aminotransferase|nr:aspartate aminotransferase family protein [Kiritimatiellia bacterium]HHU16302.1 aspartate aminotransferase family protein [Lentisphaerota bacterium]HRT29850.1 aspartate aminotransferase family protein [Kiritimatiellia bacterium]
MSKSKDIAALFNQYVMQTYAPTATITSGSGCKVRDPDGKTYLDFTSGIAVHNVGHCHSTVVKAVQDQVATLGHCSNLFYNASQALLAQRLSKLSLNGKCFFCNSGAEANEAMIKLARLWGHEKGKFEIITMQNSFHGRTLATIAATAQTKVQKGFDPLPIGFAYAEFNNLESVAAAVNERTVGVMLEAVQGEGGVIPATEEFMVGVRKLCDEKGLLMLCDEVQCGMGRTGKWFGWQNYSVTPDAFTLAKSLADGIPMGALIASPALSDVFTPGTHASTFGGNPVSSAAAMAVLDVIEEEELLKRAEETGALFAEGLSLFVDKHKQVLEIRGKGLMLGMVVEGSAKEVVDMCRDMGLLCCVAGEHVVRFLPPLNIKDTDLEEALEMIGDALDELYGEEEN